MSRSEEAGTPLPLRTGEDVAKFLSVSWPTVRYCLYRMPPSERYRTFTIPKRGGGVRTIEAPNSQIKLLQHALMHRLEEFYVPRVCVHGFTFRRSIVTNARRHVGCRWLLTVDLQDFFPSITKKKIGVKSSHLTLGHKKKIGVKSSHLTLEVSRWQAPQHGAAVAHRI
jgi:retron-type reverse transcriptase